ncbi:flavin reductase family protein [Corallococcus macrosporus]|uniref:flavin reductase family protein n=1 Tax=Corallococcus macrosporus TaxID=35 RepID=UPI0005BD68E8|nr:flavin reductase family protein [Corallococcus macrosporus]
MTQGSPEGVDAKGFRDAMAQWATGVAVVAMRDAEGLRATTVSSFSSLSLEPPLVVVALSEASRTLKRVEATGRFTLSILSAAQRSISARCAKGELDEALFDADAFVRDSLVGLSCQVHGLHRHGDHTLIVGRVTRLHEGRRQEPLLYWERGYRTVTSLPPSDT